MKQICLIQVVDSYGPNKFLPLAVGYQWLYAKQDPMVDQNWNLMSVLIEKINIDHWISSLETPPDLVAMSCYVWNWEYNLTLAESVKQRWPDCVIVAGGPQVSKHNVDFCRENTCIDVAVLGENEPALREILKTSDPAQWDQIPGIVTKNTNEILLPTRTLNLDEIPSPILSGFYDWIMAQYADDVMWQVTYETMRGCPYHCAFCDIGDEYWNKVYFFDLDRIRKEIAWMGEKKIEYVSVCDSNWGISARDKDITQLVIDSKLSCGYPKFWDVTWAKNNPDRVRDIAVMDHDAGTRLFKGITFALQSLNPPSLTASKRFNLKPGTIHDNMSFFREQDIATYSELIWPMPDETLESLCLGLQELIDIGQRDFVMVHPLVLTPNAPMSQPDYIKKYNLKSVCVPLDTFWLKIDDHVNYIVEKVDAVYETSKVNLDITIQGHIISHWLIVLYYYGWAHAIMDYFYKKYRIKHLDFVKKFINWAENNPQTLIGKEHLETQESLLSVFQQGTFWGRKIQGNVYWEYKSATSVVFHNQRTVVNNELLHFLRETFDLDHPDLMDFNSTLCFDWRQKYPQQKYYDRELIKCLLNIDADSLIFDHWDRTGISDDQHFVHKAYHWQRKNKYWCCSVRPAE